MTFSEEEICKNIVSDIETNIEETKQNIDYRKKLILEQKKYIRDSHGDMDDEEFLQNMESVNKDVQFIGHEIKKLNTMERQVDSPYFGKVSFRYAEGDELLVYVGMKGYEPENIPDIRVYDWRAPVSSLYYDYEKGAAEYMTPDGEVTGEITEKKQFDIYKGRLRQAVDTDENINDDLLLHALSDNSHSKMKEVVATIQKEQNKIIRNNSAYNLLVDGRAGSGKTVIAMHRLAWLLFNHKKTIKADNVMILSPNGIFADYISEVLPEIGEDNVPEKEFDLLMEEILFAAEEYESRLEQSDWIVVNGGSKDFEIQKRIDNIKIKSSIAFFDALNEYLDSYVAGIQFKTFRFQGVVYEKEQIERMFLERFARYPVYERFEKIAYFIADRVEDNSDKEFTDKHKEKLVRMIQKEMIYRFANRNLVELYVDFLKKYQKQYNKAVTDYLNEAGKICYEDILAVFYIQIYFYGCNSYKNIKHLVIDEMQDYNIFQFAVLDRIFDCKKTVLGDRYQVLFYDSGETVVDVAEKIFGSKKLEKYQLSVSYRSTKEITEFCNNILEMGNKDLGEAAMPECYGRSGVVPQVIEANDTEEMLSYISESFWSGMLDNYDNIAVLCDDEAEAFQIYRELSEDMDIRLITRDSVVYTGGIVALPKFLAKGMEFDVVFVINQHDPMKDMISKNAYYISCTRALHELYVINIKEA